MALKPYRVMTCAEVAKEIGITQSGVDKLEQSALKKLRRSKALFLNWLELGRERKTNLVGTE